MAAGKFTVLNLSLAKILDGQVPPGSGDFRICLCDASEALTASWTGASGNGLYSDLAAEVSGTGYTAGGQLMTGLDMVTSGSTVNISADPNVWESVTVTAKYGVVYLDTGDQDVLGFFDLETTDPAGRVIIASDLTISWPNEFLKLTRT